MRGGQGREGLGVVGPKGSRGKGQGIQTGYERKGSHGSKRFEGEGDGKGDTDGEGVMGPKGGGRKWAGVY